ncbi:MAG: hypothetical protein R3D84_07380 [Paracoccaceae bacterium]
MALVPHACPSRSGLLFYNTLMRTPPATSHWDNATANVSKTECH